LEHLQKEVRIEKPQQQQQQQQAPVVRGILRKQKSYEMEDDPRTSALAATNVTDAKNGICTAAATVGERKNGWTESTNENGAGDFQQQQQQNADGGTSRISIKNKAIARRRMMNEKQRLEESTTDAPAAPSSKRY
jgi:hypothetical protein